jgi:hypothetical protein
MNLLAIFQNFGEPAAYLIGIVLLVVKVVKPIQVMYAINALILWNILVRDHDDYKRQGYCSRDDKRRYCDLYTRYKALKLNDIADDYKECVLGLPDDPPEARHGLNCKQ